MIVVFDIDGTLAKIDHRLHHVRQKPKDWAAFDAGVSEDEVNNPVASVLFAMYRSRHTILLASGRSERSRDRTEKWLTDNGLNLYDKLYMRPKLDYRCDSIVKKEILDQITLDYGKPDMVFDDRPRVVNMWRENGIFVFDVYQGKEDF
jgi:hypothetical protein